MTEGARSQAASVTTARVWDLPTRLLKWSLAAAVVTGWILGQTMGFETIDLHFTVGYVVGGLLAVRLIWAFVGAPASRLSVMLRDLAALPRYLRTLFKPEPSRWAGHTPTGTLWLLALWATLLAQVGSGLFAYSDSFFSGGPLASSVSETTQLQAVAIHHLTSRVLLALVVLHLLAITFYAVWKGENLIGPMLTGDKEVSESAGAGSDSPRPDA